MQDALREIGVHFQEYFGQSMIVGMYIIALLWIVIKHSHYRKMIGISGIVIALIVFNPWFYTKVWMKMMDYGYWRAFWLFPITIIGATAAVLLLKKIKDLRGKIIILFVLSILIVCSGNSMYKKGVYYQKTENAFNIPQEVIDISDTLLELDSQPRAIMWSGLYCYIRQYKSSIKLMYGRDVERYIQIPDDDIRAIAWHIQNLEITDWNYVSNEMKKRGYHYLVIPENENYTIEMLAGYGFLYINNVDGYNILYIE